MHRRSWMKVPSRITVCGSIGCALFEPPVNIGSARPETPPDLLDRINRLLAADDRSAVVRSFMQDGLGVPASGVAIMRLLPMWSTMKKLAPTLPYDLTITATCEPGSHPSLERWAKIATPAIVMAGTKSDQFLQVSAQSLADTLPHGRYQALEGKNHSALVTAARLLAEEITAFFKQVSKG